MTLGSLAAALALILDWRPGWRDSWLVSGGLAFLFCAPIHFWVLRGPVHDMSAPRTGNRHDWRDHGAVGDQCAGPGSHRRRGSPLPGRLGYLAGGDPLPRC